MSTMHVGGLQVLMAAAYRNPNASAVACMDHTKSAQAFRATPRARARMAAMPDYCCGEEDGRVSVARVSGPKCVDVDWMWCVTTAAWGRLCRRCTVWECDVVGCGRLDQDGAVDVQGG